MLILTCCAISHQKAVGLKRSSFKTSIELLSRKLKLVPSSGTDVSSLGVAQGEFCGKIFKHLGLRPDASNLLSGRSIHAKSRPHASPDIAIGRRLLAPRARTAA